MRPRDIKDNPIPLPAPPNPSPCRPNARAFPDQGICAGLTKREYFAVHLMAGLEGGTEATRAKAAVKAADALIAALNQQPEQP